MSLTLFPREMKNGDWVIGLGLVVFSANEPDARGLLPIAIDVQGKTYGVNLKPDSLYEVQRTTDTGVNYERE
jgi:hypothetical protein